MVPILCTLAILIPLWKEHALLTTRADLIRSSLAKLDTQMRAGADRLGKLDADLAQINQRLGAGAHTAFTPHQRWMAVLRTLAEFAGTAGPRDPKATIWSSPWAINSVSEPFFRQLLGDPAYGNAALVLVKGAMEEQYGRLFATLNLSPENEDKLETLLAQRQMAWNDASALLGNNPSTENLRNSAVSGTWASTYDQITSDFGVQVSAQLQAYDGAKQFYNFADDLQSRLSYTETPLQPGQEDQVVAVLNQALGTSHTQFWAVPDSLLSQLEGVLDPNQAAAVAQLIEEQTSKSVDHRAKIAGGTH